MKSIITRINYRNLRNEVHVELHDTVDTLFVQSSPDSLGIRKQYDIYKPLVDDEKSSLDIIKKSGYTVDIDEQDHRRDAIFRGFVDAVRSAENHFNPLKKKAAVRIAIVLDNYGNIAAKTLDEETAAIDDMLRELDSDDYPTLIATLALEDWLTQLGTENQRFKELMSARYKETAKRPTVSMREARKKVDKAFLDIIYTIEASVLLNGITAYESFIPELNAILERYKSIYASQKKEKKQGE
jgi:hypothetical protein